MFRKKHINYFVVSVIICLSEVFCDEKSSLTFVIDETGSMADDISQVTISANAIFDTVLNSNESQIENFVLVTFNDPETNLRNITKDRNEFKNALYSINVHGGVDCPEYSMSGIIKGIENSRSGSTIYVFTDASAKDHTLYEEAKNLAIKKLIQVVFILTGMCGDKSSPDYKVYQSLARDTVGQVFHLGKHDVLDILKYVIENLKGRRTILAAPKLPPGTHSVKFTVGSETSSPSVSVAAHKPSMIIKKPDGSEADTIPIVEKDDILIKKILNAKPGVYTVKVHSTSDIDLVISARTDITFKHGFSTFKPSSINETTTTPLPDVKSHITIKLTDGNIKLQTVKILDMDHNTIKEIPLAAINEAEKLFTTKLEDFPNNTFKLAITGYDHGSGETMTIIGSPIAPQPKPIPGKVPSKAPNALIPGSPTVHAEWNEPLQLKCKVKGYPQPNIVWLNKDTGEILSAKVSVVEFPYDYISILDIDKAITNKNYQCKADNLLGSVSTSVTVEITNKPYLTIVKKPKDTFIKYHDKGEIFCKADAYPPATITWYKDRKLLLKYDNLEFSDDNSVLKIKEMDISDDGSYLCEVRNAVYRKILGAKVTVTGVVIICLSEVFCDEKSSLTFVIDETGSMADDISQVKISANAIFDTVLNSNESQIENFVLVTFNDPETNLRNITKDRNEFKNALYSINVHGGADCPEYSMSGIIKGIENSRSGSTIYVFTDASAKDHTLYEEAKNLAIKKLIQVVFILTGMCGDKSSPDYKVYQSLARDTVGQVFHLGKHDVLDILKYVIENLKGRRTILAAPKLPPGTHSVKFTVGSETSSPSVSVAAQKPSMIIKKPDGSEADTIPIVEKDDILIKKILNAKPGVYTVKVHSTSDIDLVISARTDITFKHGFSTFKPSSINETTTTPLPDVKSHITIKLTDGNIKLQTVKILDMDHNTIKEIPLAAINEAEKLFTTKLEDFPNNTFKLAITGYDHGSGETMTIIGSPIAPQPKPIPGKVPSKAPNALIPGSPTVHAEWNEPLQFKCKVKGYPQPNIVWLNKDTGEILSAKVSAVEFPYDYISILDIDKAITNKNYQCKADNLLGSDSTSVTVEITNKPYLNIVKKPKDTFIKYHDKGEIFCKADAYPPATITWYKDRKLLLKYDNLEFSDDNSVLKIKEMDISDDGSYLCEVRNAVYRKILGAKVTVTGVARPIIDDNNAVITIQPGNDAVINCNVIKGFPKPNITWYYSEFSGELTSLDKWNGKQAITIRNAGKNDSRVYSCIAKNELGSDYHEVELTVQYPPTIKEDIDELEVAVGDAIVMSCDVEGKPDPLVTWYKDNVPLKRNRKIYIYKDHSIRISAEIKDSGTYTCNATNKLGNVSRVVIINVHVPVTITRPRDSRKEVGAGTTLNLPCQAQGNPTPKTEWTYYSFNPSVPSKSMLNSLGSSTINLKNVQPEDEGYYTCTASNSGGQTNITYEIHVLSLPKIENIYTDKHFHVVEGDLVAMIKCRAKGNPPPVIRWLKNGLWVAAGDDVTLENGTLIMNNISKHDEGFYVCEAENKLGSDSDVYQVFVDKSPKPGPTTSTVVISESSSSAVNCDVPHKRTDQLRWYKNDVLIHSGELIIKNAQSSDSGVYTCRVSDFTKSTSGSTLVKVGLKPRFNRYEEDNIEYVEGTPYVLSCETTGTLKPETTWWHNGAIINVTENYHYLEMELGTHGQYVCEARNEFGSITRTFNVISTDCLIDIKTRPSKLQPLMVSKNDWPLYSVKNGFMSIPKDDYVALFCPNRFKMSPKQYVIAFCEGGTKFKINGRSYDYSNIECTEKMTHFVEDTGDSCFAGSTVMLRVAYRIQSQDLGAYEVCFDTENNVPLYTTVRMHSSVADVDYSDSKFANDKVIEMDLDVAYECDRQINLTSANLGRWFHRDDGCCFAKRMLVSPKDLFPGVPQRAAYSRLNVIPHWSTCNAESNNWNDVEQRVRSLAKATFSELVVSTGVADNLTLPGYDGLDEDIFIMDKSSNQQRVPKYLWKLVQEPATGSSLVIIQVNVPDLLPSEAASHVLCRDICNKTKWMKGSHWYDVRRGYTYCCSLKDFEDKFGYIGVFEPLDRVLSDVSLIPEYSLT